MASDGACFRRRERRGAVSEEATKGGPMKFALRTLLAVLAGMTAAFVLVVLLEGFSSIVHPFPADFDGNIPEHVRRYPDWVLAIVVPAWSFTAFAGTWTATRIASRLAGILVALLLAWAIVFNISMLPYVTWFKVVMLSCFPIGCWFGIRWGMVRRGSPGA